MSLESISAREAIQGQFDAILDARSPAEHALDHLPGALNWPALDDEQRRVVGTLYKQVNAFEARKLGAVMVARNIAAHIEDFAQDKPRDWRPLVYCWRGGQRSGTLAWFLGQVGFRAVQLHGGYKGWRAVVREDLDTLPQRFNYRVLCGRTGSGKTRLLHALAAQGAQVLDLEGLACHRGSVLGFLPHVPQPSQKRFDSLIWETLQRFNPAQPVYVESESRKIGLLRVPESLLVHMRGHGQCLMVELPEAERLALLLEDYAFFAQAPERFCTALDALVELRGRETVGRWQAQAREGQWPAVFTALMQEHYDPLYLRSLQSSYAQLPQALNLPLADRTAASMVAMARSLL
jgi:tRNA 2-selenouridine synthase